MGRLDTPARLGPCRFGALARFGPPILWLGPGRFDNPWRFGETGGFGAPGLDGITGLFLSPFALGLFIGFSLRIGAPTSSRVFPLVGG